MISIGSEEKGLKGGEEGEETGEGKSGGSEEGEVILLDLREVWGTYQTDLPC